MKKSSQQRSNEKRAEQLGMNFSSARHVLNKSIMFSFVQKLKLDNCYQCSKLIKTVKEFSIEHKKPWLYEPNAKELYFDLDNIAFSHHSCNSKAHRKDFTHKANVQVGASGYKGVHKKGELDAKGNIVWQVRIKKKKIGEGIDARALAIKWDKAAIEMFGDEIETNAKLGLL